MSIYTVVENTQLEAYLEQYAIGTLVSYKGIEAGVENTNYFVTTTQGEYVLTLVESVATEELPFILGFVAHLRQQGIAVAEPVRNRQNQLFGALNDRPAVFMRRLQGAPLSIPNVRQCEVIGHTLGNAHRASAALPAEQYQHIYQWCSETGARVLPQLDDATRHFLQEAIMAAGTLPWGHLAAGPVHADLFPDNALFAGDNLSGLIDFYHACSAPYLYDLAVTLNAWCYDEATDHYCHERAAALLGAYEHQRPLSDEERNWLGEMQKAAALRFWLSRLRDSLFPKQGAVITVKNPEGKRRLLETLINAGV